MSFISIPYRNPVQTKEPKHHLSLYFLQLSLYNHLTLFTLLQILTCPFTTSQIPNCHFTSFYYFYSSSPQVSSSSSCQTWAYHSYQMMLSLDSSVDWFPLGDCFSMNVCRSHTRHHCFWDTIRATPQLSTTPALHCLQLVLRFIHF